VLRVLERYHLLLFPSLGENFGHVVLEALLAGCPPLVSDRTYWRGLAEKGVGWDLPLDAPEPFRDVLRTCIAMDDAQFQALSQRARRHGMSAASDPEALEQNRSILLEAVARNQVSPPA
jgi:glycosyltransferase involved in cell wall biosynthesis